MTDPVENAVLAQLFPPGAAPADTIVLYDGAVQAKNGFAPWKAWDMRSPLLKLAWDLLRFQLIDNGKGNPDRTTPIGLRDSVNEILYKTDRTLAIVELLAANAKVDISAVP